MENQKVSNQDLKFINGFIEELKKMSKVEIKDGILYIKSSCVDLNNEQYKDIKGVNIEIFSIGAMAYYLDYNVDITFVMPVDFKPEDKEFLFKYENRLNRVHFSVGNKILSISDIKKLDETMDLMVKDIKESNLSPYEKFLAAYDIVKSYKSYKENTFEKSAARSTYSFIVSDYAVCVGYVNFFNELLSRLSIASDELTCNAKDGAHSIAITYIKDPKYKYNGFQLSDPTSDAIQEDYKQNPLIQNYIASNYTFDEGMKFFLRIDASPFFYEKDPNKMLEYMKGKFGDFYFKTAFNEVTRKLAEMSSMSSDKPLNIFKELLDEIGYDKYDIEDAKKTISFIQERLNKRISYEDRLEAIYNVNKFVNQDNSEFTDFVCENLSIAKQFPIDLNIKRNEAVMKEINGIKMEDILKSVYNVSNICMSAEFLKQMAEPETLYTFISAGIMLQDSIFEVGVLPYKNKLLIKNSLVNADLKSIANEIVKYDERLNALYIDVTPEINEMTLKEFKEYLEKAIEEYRVNKQY